MNNLKIITATEARNKWFEVLNWVNTQRKEIWVRKNNKIVVRILPGNEPMIDNVEEVSIDKFMKDILPSCSSVEVFLTNNQQGNLVSLTTANNVDSKPIFKWNNNYSWTFNGNLAGKSQIKKAVLSVPANIAEGFGRYHYLDKAKFYLNARGSLFELKSHLLVAADLKFMDETLTKQLTEDIDQIGIKINNLISATRRRASEQ